ncbi:MAG: hypothetical protein U5M50_16420 [Sphingobium sp.]|nr:hypothetical protein [Sphingobium sp.]
MDERTPAAGADAPPLVTLVLSQPDAARIGASSPCSTYAAGLAVASGEGAAREHGCARAPRQGLAVPAAMRGMTDRA